jgi:hypothetical protein
MHVRKELSIGGMIDCVQSYFSRLDKGGADSRVIKTSDALMSGLAIFGTKSPSLLQFDSNRTDATLRQNLKDLYKIGRIPSDSYMRELLDEINPEEIKGSFKEVFSKAQRGKVLERFVYMDEYYLLSIDGTGYFSSHEIHCDSCCKKEHKDGSVTYYHQMLSAVIVHPDEKVVIPLAPEAIIKIDGEKKNDCERNAAKRLIPDIRKDHSQMKFIVIEDGLASNGPHIDLLKKHNFRFILGAKPGDHEWLFDWVKHSDKVETVTYREGKKTITLRYLNKVPLNDSRSDLEVNFLECTEALDNGKKTSFSWVTDLKITSENVKKIMKGGRARWKIENETFNTLKTQGYHFDHNFGHGNKYLSTVLAHLMMLAFLIDQLQQTACKVFQKALVTVRNNKKLLWFRLRSIFHEVPVDSWETLFSVLNREVQVSITSNTS